MMRFMQLKFHWSPAEAHAMLSLLDELRDAIWQTYGEDIMAYCRQEHLHSTDELDHSSVSDDDVIPF